jgi:ComF family protein
MKGGDGVFDFLSVLFPKRCVFCRKPHDEGLCGDCRDNLPWRKPPDSGGVIAPLYYRETVRAALHRYKFKGFSGYGAVFGRLTAEAVRREDIDIITWVPCGFARRWARGYDQSERLARAVGERLSLPVERLLGKRRNVKSQTKMPGAAARRDNVRDVFKVLRSPGGKRVLLIDDIVTSGATAGECRKQLLSAGAASVAVCAAAVRQKKGDV